MPERSDPFILLTGRGRPPSLLSRILATVVAAGIFVLAFTVSVFVLIGALGVGLVAWGWIMWKTRGLRRELRAGMAQAQRTGGRDVTVIEGEIIRDDSREP